jgi:hypothetical protein
MPSPQAARRPPIKNRGYRAVPIEDFKLPTGDVVELVYVAGANGGAGTYFNAKRRGKLTDGIEAPYQAKLWLYKNSLVKELENLGVKFDAIASPKSDHLDAEPYRQAVLNGCSVLDLTENFTRTGEKKAADTSTTLDDMMSEIVYAADGVESKLRSVLIVDDSIASGKTAAAMITKLRDAGLPPDARVVIAVCAKMS